MGWKPIGSNGNATVSDVLSGKTFNSSNVNNDAEGTIPVNENVTISPDTNDKNYNGVSFFESNVDGDSNLASSNIKDGVNIFGVTGSYTGGASNPSVADFTRDCNIFSPDKNPQYAGVYPNTSDDYIIGTASGVEWTANSPEQCDIRLEIDGVTIAEYSTVYGSVIGARRAGSTGYKSVNCHFADSGRDGEPALMAGGMAITL